MESLVDAAVAKHYEAVPKKVHFTTYTLVYPQMDWIELDGLGQQWQRADLSAEIGADGVPNVKTKNVAGFHFIGTSLSDVVIDGQSLAVEPSKRPKEAFHLDGGKWATAPLSESAYSIR